LSIWWKVAKLLEVTLDEATARREAGELTRTDIAQAESQLIAARVQLNAAAAQVESSRAGYTAIVGREPGILAPEPDLPGLPGSAAEAFALAELANPDLAAAIATARASRERIAAAQQKGVPRYPCAALRAPTVRRSRSTGPDTTPPLQARISLFSGGLVRAQVGFAAVFPERDRQGSGPQHSRHTQQPGDRLRRGLDLGNRIWMAAHTALF
jgi:outer membrane protein